MSRLSSTIEGVLQKYTILIIEDWVAKRWMVIKYSIRKAGIGALDFVSTFK